jgi:kynurenine formamidase
MWPNQPPPRFTTMLEIERDGVFLREVCFWEHTGTHVDAPAHFFADGHTVDALPTSQLVCPAVVIDIRPQCANNADYALRVEDILAHERRYGAITDGRAILVNTGWDAFLDSAEAYVGAGQPPAFPGIGEAAARLLVNERRALVLGVDTIGIDPGSDVDFPVHRKVTLPKGVIHLEGLVRLHEVPATGAWITIGVLPWVGGSGSPARVFALIG